MTRETILVFDGTDRYRQHALNENGQHRRNEGWMAGVLIIYKHNFSDVKGQGFSAAQLR